MPPGLGSYSQWDRRIDGKIAQLFMSIPAVKAVEIGDGFKAPGVTGLNFHDEIYYRKVLVSIEKLTEQVVLREE